MSESTAKDAAGADAEVTELAVVRVERLEAVTVLTINRPEAFNALNDEVLRRLREGVEQAASDPTCRALVITGSGEKAFSAGADLKEIAAMDADQAHEAMRRGQATMRAIESAPIPVVAAVNGIALGGGFELILACTFAVMSQRASLGLPESGLGLIPGYGGTQRLPRIVGPVVAAHVMLTGTRIDADRAYQLGLTPVLPAAPETLRTTALEIATTIARQGPAAVRSIQVALAASRETPIETGLRLETGLAALAIAGAESSEGIAAFLERRDPDFSAGLG
jgi:enoyl-CoA hydratase